MKKLTPTGWRTMTESMHRELTLKVLKEEFGLVPIVALPPEPKPEE